MLHVLQLNLSFFIYNTIKSREEVLAETDKERPIHRNISDAVTVLVDKTDNDGYVTEEKELAVTADTCKLIDS